MNNNILRILSVVLAIIFWFIITNSENPITTVKFDVPIQFINETAIRDNGLETMNQYGRTVELSVRGRLQELNNIKSTDFYVSVDFKEYATRGIKTLELSEPIYTGKQNITYWISGNKTIELVLESTSTKTFTIEVIPDGIMPEKYQLASIVTVPEKITVRNLSKWIEQAHSARVEIDIDRLNGDKTYKEPLKIYDKQGKEIIALNEDIMVDIKVTVKKEVELVLKYSGQPAYDHYIDEAGITYSPTKGYVTGYADVLSNTDVVYTETVDLTGRSETFDNQVSYKLPDGLRLVDTSNYSQVRIGIKPLDYKTIEINKDEINIVKTYIDSKLTYEIVDQKVGITVKGKEKDLQNLNTIDLQPYISAPIRDGIYSLPLQVTLPDNITLVTLGMVQLRVYMTEKVTVNREYINIINKNEALYDYEIVDENVSITLIGFSDVLDDVQAENLNLFVDAAGLRTGIHRLQVQYSGSSIYEVGLHRTSGINVRISERTGD